MKRFDMIRRSLLNKQYIYPFSIDIINKYGHPETLQGTDNQVWIAYFPKGDFTILMDKRTSNIYEVKQGRTW